MHKTAGVPASVISPVDDARTDGLLARIRRAFPEVKCERVRYTDEGWDHEVVILDESLVFRFPTDQEYIDQLRAEIPRLRWLAARLPVNVPAYSHVAPDGSFAGYPMVPGENLTVEYYERLPAEQRQLVVTQLAGCLTALHGCDLQEPMLKQVTGSYMPEEQAGIRLQTTEHLPGVLTSAEMRTMERILGDVDTLLTRQLPVVLLHGDVYSRHLLWDKPARRLGLIDFSDMCSGDPAIDFAELYEYGDDFVRQVYAAYDGPKDDSFLERAWTYQEWMGVYMMTDHFQYHKTSFAVARETFDRVNRTNDKTK